MALNMSAWAKMNSLKVSNIEKFRLPTLTVAPRPVFTEVAPTQPYIVPGTSRSRPLWFDGRFLAARDLERDQHYFLKGQANLGRAVGFGVIHGLNVIQQPDAETIVIGAGQGITPGGGLVMLSHDLTVRISDLEEQESLQVQFGLSETPAPIARTRTGLYVLALRPVQFTANPITAYPASVQGNTGTQDGSIIEATAVTLVPYPTPAANFDSLSQNAAVARQVFVENETGTVSDSLLPVAMVSIDRGVIQWVDEWMARRESGPLPEGLRFGLTDPSVQQAFLMQYDAQLQQIVTTLTGQSKSPRFAATDYFQALPPAGRIPLAAIDGASFTQIYFPSQINLEMSIIPADELPAVLEESLCLPPIDLTQNADSFADLAVEVLIPVPRKSYAATAQTLKPVTLTSALPQVINARKPLDLLRYFPGKIVLPPPMEGVTWPSIIGNRVYGYYIRKRSVPAFVSFTLTATTTNLAVSPVTGSSATQYVATVAPAAATGTVVFQDGAAVIGTVDLSAGVATLVLPTLAAGTHSLTAIYQGDTNYATSTSAAVTETVPAT